jgi:hypothetical protein
MSSKKQSRKAPSPKVVLRLWATAGGRCQLEGCNEQLYIVNRSKTYLNRAYVAHIHAAEKGGPRYIESLSRDDAAKFDNLMLLCDGCHRKIDRDEVDDYRAPRLFSAKRQHLSDIKRLTDHASAPRTQILVYGSRIGSYDPPLSFRDTSAAVLNTHQPNDSSALRISVTGLSTVEDHQDNYWPLLDEHLKSEFRLKVESLQATGTPEHYSIFGFAPQPLLIRLGVLIGGLRNATCYQLAKEPETWKWRAKKQTVWHTIKQTQTGTGPVVLKIALSAQIADDRIIATLGPDCNIWTLTHANPHNDHLRSPADLADYRKIIRQAYSQIKLTHGEDTTINVFPAAPVSTMVETGRTWNPKADLPLVIYDQNKKRDGFIKTVSINTKTH